jgi:hypothetical protein
MKIIKELKRLDGWCWVPVTIYFAMSLFFFISPFFMDISKPDTFTMAGFFMISVSAFIIAVNLLTYAYEDIENLKKELKKK